MAQLIYPKNFPKIEVDRSWQNSEGHIARLTNGAYCHITGLPIQNESELRAVLTGEVLDDALDWFHNRRHQEEAETRRIMFGKDGIPLFEDGTIVENADELYEILGPGDLFKAAMKALTKHQIAQEEESQRAATEQAQILAQERIAEPEPAPAPKTKAKAGKTGKLPGKKAGRVPPPSKPPVTKEAQVTA